MTELPFLKAWTQAWPGLKPADDRWVPWPWTAARTFWVELPTEVAGRLQRLAQAQYQDQLRLVSEVSLQGGAANPVMRQAAFLQQSSLAWGTEMLEIMELYQEKMLEAVPKPDDVPNPFSKAA